MKQKLKKKVISIKKKLLKKREEQILKKINTFLPQELVHEIYHYFPLKLQNKIKPLNNCIDIHELMNIHYQINTSLYFYEYFENDDVESKEKLDFYFEKRININYVKYKDEVYNINENILVEQKLKKVAEIEVGKFHYGKTQHDNNVQQRIKLTKSINEILEIKKKIG